MLRRYAGGLLALLAGVLPAEPVIISADFSLGADYPLSKSKFAVYNSGFVPLEHYKRDLHLYREVRPVALRVDLWWGGSRWKPAVISGTSTSLSYNFSEMDQMATLLNGCGVAPYWAYCYVPAPLQSVPGDQRSTPTSYSAWGDILKTYAAHAASGPAEHRVGYHEIYNEPDNRDFFSGNINDYLQLYESGVRGIRNGDPDAVVGGPAIAFTDAWVTPFLEHVHTRSLPLDFFSFHFYPTVPYNSSTVAGVINEMRAKLAVYPEFATTEMHLNEYNSFKIDYPRGGKQERHQLASAMLSDFHYFLTQPDLTMVHWAQFQDTGGGNWSGMISRSGHRKAVFNAYKLYQEMPEDRVSLNIDGEHEVEGFASSDGSRAAMLLWNTTTHTQELSVQLQGLPQETNVLKVYRIDADHGSWGDNETNELLPLVESHRLTRTSQRWNGALPPFGVVYLEAVNARAPIKVEDKPLSMTLVRAFRHFPDRYSTSYADFNEKTLTFRLGSGRETSATEQIAVLLEPGLEKFEAVLEQGSNSTGLASATVELRLDYMQANHYTKSVAYRWGSGMSVSLPWGTMRAADEIVPVSGHTALLDPAQYAPPGWKGRILLTVIMRSHEPGVRYKINLRAPR